MRFIVAVLAIAAVIAAWTGFWFFAAGTVRDGIDNWADDQRRAGAEVSYDSLDIGGYPFRIRATVTSPRIAWPARPDRPSLESDKLTAVAHPWNFRHVLTDLGGRHTARFLQDGIERTATISVGSGLSSYQTNADDKLMRLSADLNDVTVDAAPDIRSTAKRLQVHVRPSGRSDAAYDVAVSVADATVAEPAGLPLGQHISGADAQFSITGALPRGTDTAAIAAWRDAGGTIEVGKLHIAWGDVRADADGTLALDASMRPLGALTARVRGHNALIDAAVASGQMSADDAGTAKSALSLLALAAGGVLSVPVELQDGRAYLGPVAVARLKPIF